MSNLFATMSVAVGSMLAQQSAIGVTANNVSNINTPGYSRQRADLAEGDSFYNGAFMVGTGVELQQISSLRDRILELRIQDEMQQQGALDAQVSALSDVDLQFSAQNSNIGNALNNFFGSLSSLAPDVTNRALRQSVLVAAQNLANQFQSTSRMLTQRQFSLDLEIKQGVQQVNQITTQLADLNRQISSSTLPEDQLGSFVDQRNVLLQKLSFLLGNHVVQADDGLTVTASNGSPLVVGGQAYQLHLSTNFDGTNHLSVSGRDITQSATGGSIAGLLQVREKSIPGILEQLDTIASTLITSFNAVHVTGTDLQGNAGVDFFNPAPAAGSGAAASFSLNITDADQIAASGDTTTGNNAVLNTLIDLQNQQLVDNNRLVDAYSNLTFDLGSQLSNAKSDLQSTEAELQQLNDQRGAISGVSLDEEASNLLRYQRAYEAAARVLSIVSDLTEVSVNLGR